MNISEVSVNNRLEIEFLDENPFKRCVKGIVLSIDEESIVIITDMGERLDIPKCRIVSVDRINFEKNVSESLTAVRNYYLEVSTLESRLKELYLEKDFYSKKLSDSRLISKFNVEGAINLLNDYFGENHEFRIGDSTLRFSFTNSKTDGEIYAVITNYKSFEFYNTEDKDELTRAIETYAPNKKVEISKLFPMIKDLISRKRHVERLDDYLFNAISVYEGILVITKDNFLDVRDGISEIIKTIQKVGEV